MITVILARRHWFFLFLTLPYTIALATPLHDAARSGKLSEAEKIIAQGGDVNGVTLYGFTPLLLAQLNDHGRTAQLLRSKGARTGLNALVKRIQFYLKILGYDLGPVDGLLGPGTRSAIRKFQAAERFEVTGRVYEAWVIGLHRSVWKKLQQALREQGIDPGPVDGLMGPSLRKAIRLYQQQAGLPVTGRISEDWVSRISAPTSTPAGQRKQASAQEITTQATEPPEQVFTGDQKTLREIQARLQELGFYSGPLDGELGPSTVDAIRAFQLQTGLAVTGRIEQDWIEQLDEAVLRSLRSRLEMMGYDDKVYLNLNRTEGAIEFSGTAALSSEDNEIPVDSDSSADMSDNAPDNTADNTDSHAAATTPAAAQEDFLLAQIQVRLRALGFALDKVDGSMTPATRAAIASFQRQTGQAATEQPSKALLERLDQEVIRAIQERLKTLGYYEGEVDGITGSQSESAIRTFQKKSGLAVTGKPEAGLLTQITQAVAVYEAEQAQQAAQTQRLKSIQEKLQVLGYDTGGADGLMGSKTEQAISAFQKQFKLPQISGEPGLRVLDEKLDTELTRLVQGYLQTLGFQPGEVDGRRGERTEAAIRSFQTRYKYPVDGEVTVALALALKRHVDEREAQARIAKQLQLAKEVQTELKTLGYEIGEVDGEIGPGTQKAIRSFQRKQGIKVTGKISDALLASLKSASSQALAEAQRKAQAVAQTKPSTKEAAATIPAEDTASSTPTDQPERQVAGISAADIVVRQGVAKEVKTTPDTVAEIQSRLNELGYQAGSADGIEGEVTKVAIETFERRMGDPVTGRASPDLLQKLQSKDAKPALVIKGKRTKRGNTEVRGELRLQKAKNGTLIGCSIKGVQLDRTWCSPFTARRNTDDCKAIIRPNSTVLMVKCS